MSDHGRRFAESSRGQSIAYDVAKTRQMAYAESAKLIAALRERREKALAAIEKQ